MDTSRLVIILLLIAYFCIIFLAIRFMMYDTPNRYELIMTSSLLFIMAIGFLQYIAYVDVNNYM